MTHRNKHNSKNCNEPPAWARYNGEHYVSSFSGTPKQKKEHEKAVAKLFAKRKGGKKK